MVVGVEWSCLYACARQVEVELKVREAVWSSDQAIKASGNQGKDVKEERKPSATVA